MSKQERSFVLFTLISVYKQKKKLASHLIQSPAHLTSLPRTPGSGFSCFGDGIPGTCTIPLDYFCPANSFDSLAHSCNNFFSYCVFFNYPWESVKNHLKIILPPHKKEGIKQNTNSGQKIYSFQRELICMEKVISVKNGRV